MQEMLLGEIAMIVGELAMQVAVAAVYIETTRLVLTLVIPRD